MEMMITITVLITDEYTAMAYHTGLKVGSSEIIYVVYVSDHHEGQFFNNRE